ncbi:MAG: ABC transporter ATPase [Cryomorphaceae bacterium]|nr:ABC transporter ATPase [Cryomorphaceae bacterium]
MYIPFDELPDESRIWIYQSNQQLTEKQLDQISDKLLRFIDEWSAHEQPLKASFSIMHDRFLIIGVDERYCKLTGCSIDKSTKIVQQLELDLGITFFDRFQVAFRNGNLVQGCTLTEFKKLVKEGELSINKTRVFDNMVSNKKDLMENWEKPIKKSWHYQYVR